jgi:hypothetical protein
VSWTTATVGLVSEGLFVVKVACLQLDLSCPGCQTMKSVVFSLLVGCAVFLPVNTARAQGFNSQYPGLQTPTLQGSLPHLDPPPQPQVPPGSEKHLTPPPRQEARIETPPSPAASLAAAPLKAETSEKAPAAPQSGAGFPWWPVICIVLVVMLARAKRRA